MTKCRSRREILGTATSWFRLGLGSVAMAPHSSTLAWKIPWVEEPGRLKSMGSQRVGHDWATSLSLFTFLHWRRKWQPTPVFLPGESQGRGSLVGCCLWGRTESDMTEATKQQQQQQQGLWGGEVKGNEKLLASWCQMVMGLEHQVKAFGFSLAERGSPWQFSGQSVTWHVTQDGLVEAETWRRETTRVCSNNLGRDDGLGGCWGKGWGKHWKKH